MAQCIVAGVTSGAAQATVVGVRVEVPVMPVPVRYASATLGRFEGFRAQAATPLGG